MANKKQENNLFITETISSIECYSFDKTTNYIAYGGNLTVGILNYEIKKTDKEQRLRGYPNITSELKNKLLEVQSECSHINAIAFAPLQETKGKLTFCTVGNDKAIRVYCSDLQKTQKILQEQKIHTAAVNACTFVTHPELQIATASDDHTCCVISMNTKKVINSFRFESNVVAVHSNTQHNQEIMIAEENGYIHIYDLKSGQDILSCRTEIQNGRPTYPLLDAHWHPSDFTKVGAVANNKYFIWDLRNPRQYADRNVAHFAGATRFRWAPQGNLFATCGQYDTVKIWDYTRSLSHTYKQQFRIGGLSWTNTQPSCVVTGSDRKINFWVTGL